MTVTCYQGNVAPISLSGERYLTQALTMLRHFLVLWQSVEIFTKSFSWGVGASNFSPSKKFTSAIQYLKQNVIPILKPPDTSESVVVGRVAVVDLLDGSMTLIT